MDTYCCQCSDKKSVELAKLRAEVEQVVKHNQFLGTALETAEKEIEKLRAENKILEHASTENRRIAKYLRQRCEEYVEDAERYRRQVLKFGGD
jgi:predicted RNase H-like nuclease (RuvC/YqgF family)